MGRKLRHTVPDDDASAVAWGASTSAEAGDDADSRAATMPADPIVFGLLDDAELVERAKTASDAFAALYDRHVRSVFAFVLSRVRETATAEDLTSQTFLQALRALPKYEQRGVPFKSWLFRIAANLIADRHRSPQVEGLSRRSAGSEGDCDQTDMPDPRAEEDIAAWERAEAFARLIADLTTEQQTAVQLRFVDCLPLSAIASQMARSEGAVKMLLMRALQNLRRSLALETDDA